MMIRIIATNQTNIVNHKLSIQQKCSYSCGYHNNISEEVVELSQDISDDPEACSNLNSMVLSSPDRVSS